MLARVFIILASVFLLGATTYQLFYLYKEKNKLGGQLQVIEANVKKLQTDKEKIEEEIGYLEKEENLLKEAKTQFNYAKPDEKLIIIVPEKSN